MYKRGFIIFGVVSLTMGNSRLPIRYGLAAHAERLRRALLSQFSRVSRVPELLSDIHLPRLLFSLSVYAKNSRVSIKSVLHLRIFRVKMLLHIDYIMPRRCFPY